MKHHKLKVKSKDVEDDKQLIFTIIETNKHFDISWYVDDMFIDHDQIEKESGEETIEDLIKILVEEGLEVEKL